MALITKQTVPRSVRYRAKDLSQLVIRTDAAVGAVFDGDHSWQFLGVQDRIPESWYSAGCGNTGKAEEKRNPGEK